ncbi:3-oxoacyl-[acyl-carrier-protein] synthase III C-terminal domain-containing protein [Embleya sp. NPDC020886]|uniref:3-oxoacyl-[acyl-carrier-protein] synthase III C-terminal domain-containing protein n=1 Tax=Embleya sp. NPDC020886 TaxID=3363980 RepID=UPI0037ABEC44
MKVSGLGIAAVGSCTAATPLPSLLIDEAALRDTLTRGGLSGGDLDDQYCLLCDRATAGAPIALSGRLVLDRLGVGRIHAYHAVHCGDHPLSALGTLAAHLAVDPAARRGLILAPSHQGRPAAALVLEKGLTRRRLLAVSVRDHRVGADAHPGIRIPGARTGGTGPAARPRITAGVQARRHEPGRSAVATMVDRVSVSWRAHHGECVQDAPIAISAVIAQTLRQAGVAWSTIDHVALHTPAAETNRAFRRHFGLQRHRVTDVGPETGHPRAAGLLIAARMVFESDHPTGTRVLLTSLGGDGALAAAVVEI